MAWRATERFLSAAARQLGMCAVINEFVAALNLIDPADAVLPRLAQRRIRPAPGLAWSAWRVPIRPMRNAPT